jgi:hypothetical protein
MAESFERSSVLVQLTLSSLHEGNRKDRSWSATVSSIQQNSIFFNFSEEERAKTKVQPATGIYQNVKLRILETS